MVRMAKILTQEQTKRYLIAWREYQDKDALTVLVEYNQGLVGYFASQNIGKGLSYEELISAGNFGLLKAINGFDYKETSIKAFSSYISVAINREMKRDIKANDKHSKVVSFDDPIYGEDDDLKIEDILGTDADELLNSVIDDLKIDVVRAALKSLSHQEQQIVLLRYGLDDKHRKSLEEVAEIFNCSRQSISLQEKKALIKMRHPRNTKKLKDFLDD